MQFTATLFDNLYKRFYGQTWFSDWHRGKLATDSFFRVNLSEVNYNTLFNMSNKISFSHYIVIYH